MAGLQEQLLLENTSKGVLAKLADCLPVRSSSGNRLPWKMLCTVCLVGDFVAYFYYVYSTSGDTKLALLFIGSTFLVKNIIEIWGQETSTWVCPGNCFMFVIMYVMVIPSIVALNSYCTMAVDLDFPKRGVMAVALFTFGSLYSLGYELDRFNFKKLPENKGKLHTRFLAALSIHPNYLGDLFAFSGWAIAAGTMCSLSVPLLMVFSFATIVIPNADKYLAERYSTEFPAYAEATATLIPFFKSERGLRVLGWLCLAVSLYFQGATCGPACGM
eukprot:TRINITY_DN40369_c0_g1_i1.p1 TRINITY_DN40369_c0_g1~~TRINITY_DN40369_c0_g1_i1.p1  ORF type:complete len:302 (+),score=32.90 TRINITY_DN40369_c0_g1_i1:89-907(+)